MKNKTRRELNKKREKYFSLLHLTMPFLLVVLPVIFASFSLPRFLQRKVSSSCSKERGEDEGKQVRSLRRQGRSSPSFFLRLILSLALLAPEAREWSKRMRERTRQLLKMRWLEETRGMASGLCMKERYAMHTAMTHYCTSHFFSLAIQVRSLDFFFASNCLLLCWWWRKKNVRLRTQLHPKTLRVKGILAKIYM